MFHLALYFDEKTNQKFSFLNKKVEKELHQNYLENHHIPFHLTIATYKEIEEKKFIEQANQLFEKESSQELYFVSLGCFQKSTLYEQQTNQAFKILNHYFEPFYGKVIQVALVKTNPYQEIKIWNL